MDDFYSYLQGYKGNISNTSNRNKEAYKNGKKGKKNHKEFLRGAKDSANHRPAVKSTVAYLNGFGNPDYLKWHTEAPMSWENPDAVKVPALYGKPFRCGITVTSYLEGHRMILLGRTKNAWSLIGGKSHSREHILKCAEREFEEETKHIFREKPVRIIGVQRHDSNHVLFLIETDNIQVDLFHRIHGDLNEEELSDLRWFRWNDIIERDSTGESPVEAPVEPLSWYVLNDMRSWEAILGGSGEPKSGALEESGQ